MMFLRLFMTCVLIAALPATGALAATHAHVSVAAQDAAGASVGPPSLAWWEARRASRPSPTEEEKREARELAERFTRRFGETHDVAPLIEELFAEGFEDALRQSADVRALEFVERDVVARVPAEDLRRFFVAEFNFTCLSFAYLMEQSRLRELSRAESAEDVSVMDVYPAGALDVLRSDPTYVLLREKMESEERAESAGEGSGREFDPRPIKSLEQMRRWGATMERASAVLRASVPSLAVQQALERDGSAGEWDGYYTPDLYVLEEIEYGLPAGTRLIRARVQALLLLQFRFGMARDDGRLKIVTAEVEIDGD